MHRDEEMIVINKDSLQLNPTKCAVLVENLIMSLDKPDSSLDDLRLKEAKSRVAAYFSGELDAIDASEVFEELGRKIRK